MNQTFQNSAQVLSIGIFFTLMILGLASSLPHALAAGLEAHGVSAATASGVAHLPPVSILFAAFLGYNPIEHLLGPHVLARALGGQPRGAHRPLLLPAPDLSAVSLGAARGVPVRDRRLPDRGGASLMRGGNYHHVEQPADTERRWRRRPEGERSESRRRDLRPAARACSHRPTTAEEQHAR